jgi:pimeloyl-ACP methyl ester carboxylesterase
VAATIADGAFISAFDMLDNIRGRLAREGAPLGVRIGLWFASLRSLAGVMNAMVQAGGGDDIDARRGDLMPVLPRIRVPVLFISGLSDDISPTTNTYKMIAAVKSHGTRIIELHAGHETYHDAPVPYEAAVLRFLSSVVSSTPCP